MDARSQELLEYPALRARLAGYASFPPSRRLAEALVPSSDPVIVARLLDETDEARAFLSGRPDVGIGGARDIGMAIGRADRGGRLDPADLVSVADTLVAAGRLGDALRPVELPRLHELARMITPLPSLRDRLLASIDPAGEILDSASPALGGLRRGVRIAYERLRARLEQLVHGAELGSALQEPIVTLRNGRYVIPVRADAKGKVRGIVHDQSGSGQTLFIEPLVAVELGNAWREAQLKVQVEEERILDELSALVGSQAPALRETLDALARFDFWASRARLAAELDGIRAATSRQDIVLLSARHPGLSGRVVPIDLRLGDGYTALVITGPNTGGKTVALRTLGLLCLMHQSGLHVPAATGSRLPILRDVFADIGDEQSIAQSLSTFSGHLRSIVRIVSAAGPGCLVLDELGAGTDPTEGSALAQALLDQFIRSGALVVATTHYAELKIYAHDTPQARNASVEFDLETLSPTYRLTIGLPGTSQAFAIAARLGLSPELVADARSRLSRAQQDFEQTLASIKASQQDIDSARETALVAEGRAQEARRLAEDERRRARQERREAAAAAREEAEQAVAAIHAEIAAARDLLSRQTLTETRLDEAMARLEGRLAAIQWRGGSTRGTSRGGGEWRVGDRASTHSGWVGTIAAVDPGRGRATLAAGGAHVEVPLSELEHGDHAARRNDTRAAGEAPAERPGTGRRGDFGAPEPARGPTPGAAARAALASRPGPARAIPSTLDVRGARVDEVIELLDQTLDQAAMAGAGRLTVIHGHGTGRSGTRCATS